MGISYICCMYLVFGPTVRQQLGYYAVLMIEGVCVCLCLCVGRVTLPDATLDMALRQAGTYIAFEALVVQLLLLLGVDTPHALPCLRRVVS